MNKNYRTIKKEKKTRINNKDFNKFISFFLSVFFLLLITASIKYTNIL